MTCFGETQKSTTETLNGGAMNLKKSLTAAHFSIHLCGFSFLHDIVSHSSRWTVGHLPLIGSLLHRVANQNNVLDNYTYAFIFVSSTTTVGEACYLSIFYFHFLLAVSVAKEYESTFPD